MKPTVTRQMTMQQIAKRIREEAKKEHEFEMDGEIRAIDDSQSDAVSSASNAGRQDRYSISVKILRWIVLLPAAVLGSTIVYWIVIIISRFGIAQFVDPNSVLGLAMADSAASLVLGAGFVWITAAVAPDHKRRSAVVSSCLLIFLSGAFMLAGIMQKEVLSILYNICMVAGGVAMAYNIYRKPEP